MTFFGNAGGAGQMNAGGGGGGAGGGGGTQGDSTSGTCPCCRGCSKGGDGKANDFSGASVVYAAGAGTSPNHGYSGAAPDHGKGHGGKPYVDGSDGVVILRFKTADYAAPSSMRLQSVSVPVAAAPARAALLVLYEDAAGEAVLNTDLKGFVSRDGGTTWTELTLVTAASAAFGYATASRRLASATDAAFAGAAGTDLRWRVELANQAPGVKETKVDAVNLGYY